MSDTKHMTAREWFEKGDRLDAERPTLVLAGMEVLGVMRAGRVDPEQDFLTLKKREVKGDDIAHIVRFIRYTFREEFVEGCKGEDGKVEYGVFEPVEESPFRVEEDA